MVTEARTAVLRPPARECWGPPGVPEAGRASRRSEALADRRTETPRRSARGQKTKQTAVVGTSPGSPGGRLWAPDTAALFKPWSGIQSSQAAQWAQTEREGSGPAGSRLQPVRGRVCAQALQSCPTLNDPTDWGPQTPLSTGLSRQEHWRRLPWPPPCERMHV